MKEGMDSEIPMGQTCPEKAFSYFEFWPDCIFFLPVIFYYVYMSVRYRSMTLPSVCNPGFPDSKSKILDLLPDHLQELVAPYRVFHPSAYNSGSMVEEASKLWDDSGFGCPVVAKPDLGLQGTGVRLLHNHEELKNYLIRFQSAGETLFQKYIDWPGEAGVLYTRMPDEAEGRILSLAFKYSPVVTGDGYSTLKELILSDERARKISHIYLKHNRPNLNLVLKKGETFELVFIRNHDQGGIYRNMTHHVTPALSGKLNEISKAIPEFYFGRYDVRFREPSEFLKGNNFAIIEINGALSQPGCIYDASTRLIDAYRTLLKMVRILFQISSFNRRRGHKPISVHSFFSYQRRLIKFVKKYSSVDNY